MLYHNILDAIIKKVDYVTLNNLVITNKQLYDLSRDKLKAAIIIKKCCFIYLKYKPKFTFCTTPAQNLQPSGVVNLSNFYSPTLKINSYFLN